MCYILQTVHDTFNLLVFPPKTSEESVLFPTAKGFSSYKTFWRSFYEISELTSSYITSLTPSSCFIEVSLG